MKAKFDLISVGDTTLDVFLELEDGVKILKDKKTKQTYLGLIFPKKIPVKKMTYVPAVGNSANVAVGASRLGLKTALRTFLGSDDIGKEMMKILKKENVASNYIVFDKNKGSNFSAVLNYKAERTILVHHEKRDYNLPKLQKSRWIYFSSLAQGHEKLHSQIPSYVKKWGAKLGFNPGSFQIREGINKMRPILLVTDVLFVNREEAQTLVGKEKDIKKLLLLLRAKGPQIPVITDGPKGSYALDGDKFYYLKIFPALLVERTGAGDSFSTGFISALAYGKKVPEAMCWGTVNSSSVIQKIGAREGLLKKKEIQDLLKEHPSFKPKKI